MTPTTDHADDIQRQMQKVRSEMNDDVRGVVENARKMFDWEGYVRRNPWASVGVAAAIGFLAVPAKVQVIKPDRETLEELAKAHKLSLGAGVTPPPSQGIANRLTNMIVGMILHGGMNLLSGQLQGFLARHANGNAESLHEGKPPDHAQSHH